MKAVQTITGALLTAASPTSAQGGFNRWTHKKSFGPLKMTPPTGEGSHFSATIALPRSAHAVDFVLSNVPEGEGIYDNRGGLDYHLPVEGSEVRCSSACLRSVCAAMPDQFVPVRTLLDCTVQFPLSPCELSRPNAACYHFAGRSYTFLWRCDIVDSLVSSPTCF